VRVGTAVLLVACTAAAAERVDVEQVMGDFGLSADAAARIRSGDMVESDPTESSDRELAVGLTFLVQQPIASVLEAFRSAVDMKADLQLLASAVIRGSPVDFATPALQLDEAKRYVAARPGDALNLSLDEIPGASQSGPSAPPLTPSGKLVHRAGAQLARRDVSPGPPAALSAVGRARRPCRVAATESRLYSPLRTEGWEQHG